MKKKALILLVILMSLSLIGIIIVQGYWIKKNFDMKEEQFSYSARQSLIDAAEWAKNQEIDKYYARVVAMVDTIEKPNYQSFSQIFHLEKDSLNNDIYLLHNSILQEDYKIRSDFPGEDLDTIDFKKMVQTKVTIVRKDDDKNETSLSEVERLKQVTRMVDDEKRFLFLEAIQDKVELLPLYTRISKEDLKENLAGRLKARGIKSDFEFGVFSNGLATKVITRPFDRNSEAAYSTEIFPSENSNYKLYVYFPDKQKEIISSIFWLAGLSLVFTIIIILAYGGTIYQFIKQRRINEMKTDFVNNMTHEFKTPIATINLALDSMNNPKVSGDPERLKTYLSMIRSENHRMHAQVENVLRISQMERNELDLNKDRLQLNDLIEMAMSRVQLIVQNRDGYIKTHLDATQNAILANETHFVNVLVNILENAVKYSEDAPKIDIYTHNAKNYIIINISDQGKGMSKAVQKKIFDKFYREPTGDIHNVKGHGLGLSYAKQIVEDHQGEITVESEKGKGSTFIIKLPLIS